MHEAKECTITDPKILKWIFPKNCFWKVHGKWVWRNFSTLTRFTNRQGLPSRRTIASSLVSNGARLDGGTHFIPIAEEQCPGYYDVFEHVFDAVSASFEGVPEVEASRGPEQFRLVLQPRTRIHLPLPLARKLGFVGLTIGEDTHKAESYFMVAPFNRRSRNFRIISGRRLSLEILIFETDRLTVKLNPPLNDLNDSDLMWEFTNYDVEDWMASYFPREHYINKRYRRLVLEMRETCKDAGIKTDLGPGMDIVDLRDRFYVTMSPGVSLRFSLPIAHMFGFMGDNFALMSQYKDGRFQIQHGVQRMSWVWVQQPGLPLRFEIAPPYGTANYNPPPFPRVDAFSIASNLNVEPLFDGYKKSRDLRKIVTKETSHVQETFMNVHFFKLEQQRIKQLEIASKLDAEREILFRSGSVVVTLQFGNRREHLVKRSDFYLTLPSNASTSVYANNGPSGFKVTLPNVYELHGDEWQVGFANFIYPRTWVNMPVPTNEELKEFRHQGVFYARIFSGRRPARYNDQTKYPNERWVPLHMAQGHYETVEDLMRGVRQALLEKFGQSLADQEFKFTFDEDGKRLTITIPAFSVLALNPWMVDLLESDTFGENVITCRPFPSWTKYYEQFAMLGLDEYSTVLPWTAEKKEEEGGGNQNTTFPHFHLSCPNRQGNFLARIPPGLSEVGDVQANLLRVIAPKGSHGDVISENFVHLFYNDVWVKSFNTIEIL